MHENARPLLGNILSHIVVAGYADYLPKFTDLLFATLIGTIRSDEERLVPGDFTACLLQFEERHGCNATDSL